MSSSIIVFHDLPEVNDVTLSTINDKQDDGYIDRIVFFAFEIVSMIWLQQRQRMHCRSKCGFSQEEISAAFYNGARREQRGPL